MRDNRSKEHRFNIDDAKEYGVECAVILYNLRHWLDKNIANKKHFHDGRVWTYNTASAFAELFPYLTSKQIYRRLKKMEDEGVIVTGNYNKHNYDQTKWYSVNESYYRLSDNGNSNSQNRKMEIPESGNANSESGEPIPDNKTHIENTDERERRAPASDYDLPTEEEWIAYCMNHGFLKEYAEHVYNQVSAIGWVNGSGNPIRDWKRFANMKHSYQYEFLEKLKKEKDSTSEKVNFVQAPEDY